MKKQNNKEIINIDKSSITFNFKSKFINIKYLCASVVGICTMQLMNRNRIEKLELYLSEVTSNIVKHAYMNDDDKYIKAVLLLRTDGIKIDIYDWGKCVPEHALKSDILPNNTVQLNDVSISGRGLYLIQTLTDEFQYISQNESNIHCCFQSFH